MQAQKANAKPKRRSLPNVIWLRIIQHMKIAVIAANGRTGRAFVRAALAAGHEVNAGVIGANPFPENLKLHVMQCDATKPNEVHQLLKGQDVVVSLIGHVKKSPADVQTTATHTVVNEMNNLNMHRIVSLTGTGVQFPGDQPTRVGQLLNAAINIIDPNRVADGKNHAHVLHQSNTDWTLIRVLKLTNGDVTPYHLTTHGPPKPWVARTEVAQVILEVLTHASFVKQAPIISR